jgi:3-dehydroquinate synthase
MRTLEVRTTRAESRCPIWVGEGLIERIGELTPLSSYSAVVLVADSNVTTMNERARLATGVPLTHTLELSGGESQKSLAGLSRVWEFLADRKLDRRSLVIAIGGGATTDLVGFAASTYMRGIAVLNIPTTLLAHVDASVGGKNGINFHSAKNILGTITQPAGVIIDVTTLASLPDRELRSGFAEVIKHGLILDRDYFTRVTSRHYSEWTPAEMAEIVFRSCELKRGIVESDESELGARKMLNFGHTVGHAVESFFLERTPSLTHGEAISIGMVAEATIAHHLSGLPVADLESITGALRAAGLPTDLPTSVPVSELKALLSKDKKRIGGTLRWSLLESIGTGNFDQEVPEEVVNTALSSIQPRDPR